MRWIIGGTSGIGKAVASLMAARHDADRVITSDASDCDVRGYDNITKRLRQVVGSAQDENDQVRTIVFSAGVNELAFLGTMSRNGTMDAGDVIDVNLIGFIRLMDAVMDPEVFPEAWRDGLTVIAVSSDAASRPMRTSMAYCASKAGLDMAIRVAARELAGHGIRVLGIAPGMTMGTKMTQYIDRTVPALRGWTQQQAVDYEIQQEVTPGRIHPVEIATTILMMEAGPRHWTGDIVTVNGGR